MVCLLDSDVLIHCLRGTAAAGKWLAAGREEQLVVPGIAAMELVAGCRNRADLARVQRFMGLFPIAWHGATELGMAYDLLVQHRLAHGMGIPDSILAATALARGARLLMFNLRHFRVVPGLDVHAPYRRGD